MSADHVDVVVLGSYGNFAYIDPSWDDYINGRTNTCPTSPCDNSALDLRVLRAFFQTHFQTYGRTVVLHGFTSSQSLTGASLANAIQSYASSKGFTPFAIVGGGRTGRAAPAFADAGIEYLDVSPPAFPLFYWASALDHRPVSGPCAGHHCYWSFQPTLDEVLDNGASWICHSLAGAPPTGTADPTIRLSPARKIVLGYTKPDDENFLGGSLSVIREVADRTDRECGCPAGPKCRNKGHVVDMDNSPFLLQQTFGQAAGDPVGNLMVAGDTSVVCVLCEQFGLDYWAVDESNANYYPEMLVLSGDTADNYNGRYLNQAYFNGGIAIAPFWQLAGYTHTYWYRAYHSVDPTTTVGLLTGITDYQEFMQLFSAIQLAGSTLTPGRVEAGFMTWQRSFRPGDTAGLRSASPAAGYTSDVPSFLHGMVEERWDSSCVPPEGPYPNTLYESGGYRILDYQDRFSTIADLAHDLTRWFDQDDSAESPVQAPCTGDDIGVEGSGVP